MNRCCFTIAAATRRAALLPLVALLLMLSGCGASRQVATKQPAAPKEIPAQISKQTPAQRYELLCRTYADWNEVTMPVRLTLTEPKSLNLSARATMKRGQYINMSVRMLGFEVAALWLDTDSIHIVDRYHKAYFSAGVAKAFGNAGLTVNDIQDLLLGRGFLAGPAGGTFTTALAPFLTLHSQPEGVMILPTQKPRNFEYGFVLAPDANRLAATSITIHTAEAPTPDHPVITRDGTFLYTDPVTVPNAGAFASSATIRIPLSKPVTANLEWDFAQATWNSGDTRSWRRPSADYRRLSSDALLRIITSL